MQSTKARKSALQKKLVAAVAMLLVSCIMVVNSTYAWFTLSTAPEITGISTSVGANGNLEMALVDFMPTSDNPNLDLTKIVTGVNDSLDGKTDAAGVKDANKTWGNLVTMKDPNGEDVYHLDTIVLKPSRLNVENGLLQSSMLMTPVYGSDGRVSTLSENTAAGAYSGNGFTVNSGFGVRAVGSASAMTPGELAIRNALSAISSNKRAATEQASAAIQANGGTLGDIAVKHGLTSDGSDKYTGTQMNAVYATVNTLNEAVSKVESALKNAAIVVIVGNSEQSIEISEADITIQLSEDAETNTVFKYKEEVLNTASNAGITAALNKYAALKKSVDAAVKACEEVKVEGELTEAKYTWAQISKPLEYLLQTANLKVNGMTTSEISGNTQKFVDAVTSNNMKVDLVMAKGSGLFADLAEFCEDFSTTITLNEIVYSGISLKNISATMRTDVETAAYLPAIYDALKGTKAGDAKQENKADAAITDYYGYIIDLAFRTNATGASLQLQTTGIDRIYSENDGNNIESTTQGGGSYMLFKATDLSADQLNNLMSALRVVFFDPADNNKVLGIATVDATTATTTAAEGTKAYLKLMNYTIGEDGILSITTAKTTSDGKPDGKLMELQQSTAKQLSALVYLDGDKVFNKDVANGDVSMIGTMNLQFSTDANLTPMDYTPLMDQSGNDSGSSTDTTEYTITYIPGENATMPTDAPAKYTASTANTITLPTPTTTATDVTFDGWYTEENGSGTKITSLQGQTGNLTLYANWTSVQDPAPGA